MNNEIQQFLNEEWIFTQIGRSPVQIAKHLGTETEKVKAVLRNRRKSLTNRASYVPIEDVLEGFVYFVPDPYRMMVRFYGESEEGKEIQVELTADEMEEAIRQLQDTTA